MWLPRLAATKFTTNGIATQEVAIAVCVAYVSVQVPSSHAAMQQQAKARQVRIRVPGRGPLPWGAVARLRGAPSPSWRRPRSPQQAAAAERVTTAAEEAAQQPAPDTPASKTVEGRFGEIKVYLILSE